MKRFLLAVLAALSIGCGSGDCYAATEAANGQSAQSATITHDTFLPVTSVPFGCWGFDRDANGFQIGDGLACPDYDKGLSIQHDTDGVNATGVYIVTDYAPDGTVRWTATFHNTVVTVGKNLALDTYLSGSSYTVTGPYMGLISSTSYSAISASDTMSSHSGWLEAGSANAPTYSGSRGTVTFSSASAGSKASSAAVSFSITGTGTVKGCFIVFGSGASATIANTSGTLYSAGLFTGGDETVGNGDTLNVNYTASM